MTRFRNDTGSVLSSTDFGLLPPGEFEAAGYDRDVHGVIPGCTRLDDPPPADTGTPPEPGSGTASARTARKHTGTGTEQDKETTA